MASRPSLPTALLSLLLLLHASPAASMVSRGRPGHGFIGYGIEMYPPPCAYACQGAIVNPLLCSGEANMSDTDGMNVKSKFRLMEMSTSTPSTVCKTSNDVYLQTLAYCISTHCKASELWELEQWWHLNVAGRQVHQPEPKYSYQEALERVLSLPNFTVPSEETLTEVSLVDEESYLAAYNGDYTFELSDARSSQYGLVVFITECAIPIALSLLRLVPFPKTFVSRFNAIFVYPPLFGSHHRVPLLNTAFVPTRGQAIFIAYILIINIILTSVGYQTSWPNNWWVSKSQQVVEYVANRAGALSLANLAVLALYAGRNNALLWLTNWSHSTFLLLHRWIAVVCVVQACLHSALYLQMYTLPKNGHDYGSESRLPYWYWGIVSTLAMTIMLPLSILQFRQKLYEIFLASHVVLALLAGIGYYYHIVYRFGHQWGYETWIYIFFAIWAFDRLVRALKMARNGIRHAQITVIDEEYLRIDVRGVCGSGHAYLYFPTLTWRVWENHPFSVAGSLVQKAAGDHAMTASLNHDLHEEQKVSSLEKAPEATARATVSTEQSDSDSSSRPTTRAQHFETSLTFFVRTHTGITKQLRGRKTVPVMIEAPYGGKSCSSHAGTSLESYPRLVCIAGGVGITAVMSIVSGHHGSRTVHWGLRSHALADAVRCTWGDAAFAGVELNVVVGKRMDIATILEQEIREGSYSRTDIAVVVSGPPSLADNVRTTVGRLASEKSGGVVAFVEESYSW